METKNYFLKIFYLLFIFTIACSGCKKDDLDKDEEKDDNNNNIINPVVTFDDSYFPYYKGSRFQYDIEYRDSDNDITTGEMLLEVTNFDSVNHVSTFSVSLVYNGGFPLGDVFYLRKTDGDLIEKSNDGSSWHTVLDLNENPSTDMSFVIAGPIGKPSDCIGDINRDLSSSSVTVPVGTLSSLKVKAEYIPNSYDPYMYSNDCIEHYSKELGFAYSYDYYYDASMGYPYIISVTRTIKMKGYEIHLPDGTVNSGGQVAGTETPPDAPDNLEIERTSSTTASITWADNSLNETAFDIERKEYDAGSWQSIGTATQNDNEFTDNSLQSDKRYEYRVKAINDNGSSDYTDIVLLNLYGVPTAPWGIDGGYNNNLYFVFVMWWAKVADNINHFQIAYWTGTDWIDLGFTVEPTVSNVVEGAWLQSSYIYYNGGQPWPSGIYRFKVKAVNSYGESFYSDYVDVTVN